MLRPPLQQQQQQQQLQQQQQQRQPQQQQQQQQAQANAAAGVLAAAGGSIERAQLDAFAAMFKWGWPVRPPSEQRSCWSDLSILKTIACQSAKAVQSKRQCSFSGCLLVFNYTDGTLEFWTPSKKDECTQSIKAQFPSLISKLAEEHVTCRTGEVFLSICKLRVFAQKWWCKCHIQSLFPSLSGIVYIYIYMYLSKIFKASSMADHRTIARDGRILPEPIFDSVSQQCVKTESLGYFGILHTAASPPLSKYVPVPRMFRPGTMGPGQAAKRRPRPRGRAHRSPRAPPVNK